MRNETHSSHEFRVLVTGGRGYPDREAVFSRLATCRQVVARRGLKLIVIHGDCPTGADHWAALWCRREGINERRYPAQWNLHGRSAGPRRNQRMLDEEQPGLVLAFPGGRGTADLVRKAHTAGVLVAHLDSQVMPQLSHAPPQGPPPAELGAEMIMDSLPRATCNDEEGVTNICDLGR